MTDKSKRMSTKRKADEVRRLIRDLRRDAASGDLYAKESIEAAQEELIRSAGIITDPGLPKGRRKEALHAALKRIASEKVKISRGM